MSDENNTNGNDTVSGGTQNTAPANNETASPSTPANVETGDAVQGGEPAPSSDTPATTEAKTDGPTADAPPAKADPATTASEPAAVEKVAVAFKGAETGATDIDKGSTVQQALAAIGISATKAKELTLRANEKEVKLTDTISATTTFTTTRKAKGG